MTERGGKLYHIVVLLYSERPLIAITHREITEYSVTLTKTCMKRNFIHFCLCISVKVRDIIEEDEEEK